MNEIDSMDMLGFLKVRAWDARREYDRTHAEPKKKYIDEIWPAE